MKSQDWEAHVVRAFPVQSHMDISKEPFGPQSRDTHFVRACAIETHMDISQEISQEPFCMEIYRKSAAPEFRCARCVLEFTGKKRTWPLQKSYLFGYLQENCRSWIPGPAFCRNLREKRTGTFHKSNFVWKFAGKIEHRATVWGKMGRYEIVNCQFLMVLHPHKFCNSHEISPWHAARQNSQGSKPLGLWNLLIPGPWHHPYPGGNSW